MVLEFNMFIILYEKVDLKKIVNNFVKQYFYILLAVLQILFLKLDLKEVQVQSHIWGSIQLVSNEKAIATNMVDGDRVTKPPSPG